MKTLLDLQLSIPSIDELTSRKLMGGDGYIPENDLSNALPKSEIDDMVEIVIGDDVLITGDYPGVPNAPTTEYDIPEPEMEPIEIERPENNEEPEFDDDRNDLQNNSNENNSLDENQQGNTGNQINSENGYPDWAEIVLSHMFVPLREYVNNLDVDFLVDPNLPSTREAHYNSETNSITVRTTELTYNLVRGVTHELIHAVQRGFNITDNVSRANIEFQAHLLTDIMMCYVLDGTGGNSVTAGKDDDAYSKWLFDMTHFGDESDKFNIDLFNSQWEQWFPSFNERYTNVPSYQGINEDYDWKWDEMIEAFFESLENAQPPLFFYNGEVGG